MLLDRHQHVRVVRFGQLQVVDHAPPFGLEHLLPDLVVHGEDDFALDEIFEEIHFTQKVECGTLFHPLRKCYEFSIVSVLFFVFLVDHDSGHVNHKLVSFRHLFFFESLSRNYQVKRSVFKALNINIFIVFFLTYDKLNWIFQSISGKKCDCIITCAYLQLLVVLIRIFTNNAVHVFRISIFGAHHVGLEQRIAVHGRQYALTADGGVWRFVQWVARLHHHRIVEVYLSLQCRQFDRWTDFVHRTAQFVVVEIWSWVESI